MRRESKMGNSRGPRLGAWLVLVGLLFPQLAGAQEDFPYELKNGTEMGLILASAAAFGVGAWLDRDFRPLIPEEIDALQRDMVNVLDRPATLRWAPKADRASDHLVKGQWLAPMALPFTEYGSDQPTRLGVMYLETMALNSGLTYLLKNTFNRSRPFVYNRDHGIDPDLKMSRTARKSFPSGHTSNAFASMVFLATVYEKVNPESSLTGTVWAGCLATATVTGVLRVTSGRHFTTDVLAGAALGSLVGYLVPKWHELDNASKTGAKGAGLSLSFGFRF